jgi:hypothetical protein
MRRHLSSQVVAGARTMWGFRDKGPTDNEVRFKRMRSPEELAKIAKKRAREKRKKKEAERERLAKIQEDEEERQWLIEHGELDPDEVAVDAQKLLEDGPVDQVGAGPPGTEDPPSDGEGGGNGDGDDDEGGIAFRNDGRVMSDDDMDDPELANFVVDTGASGMHEDDISTVGGGVHLD